MVSLPVYSHPLVCLEDLNLQERTVFFYTKSSEDRSDGVVKLLCGSAYVTKIEVSERPGDAFSTSLNPHDLVWPRKNGSVRGYLKSLKTDRVIIDITGMEHSVWAPILKDVLKLRLTCDVLYTEPLKYKSKPLSGIQRIHDLSEEIKGIKPIPQFASLGDDDEENFLFVPLLGFEGRRLAHMLNILTPEKGMTHPIVGHPGYFPPYSFTALWENRQGIKDYDCARNIRFSTASCPFSLYGTLELIHKNLPECFMKVGLIGTKPHALGAILYAMSCPTSTELVYDHAIRKENRSSGVGKMHHFQVSKFMYDGKRLLA